MTLPNFATASFPEMYDRHLVPPLFRPWAELLLELAPPARGDRVLDVACGTGIVARLAQEKVGARGRVGGVDLSPAMLGVARTASPDIEWREGSAVALPVEEGEAFDIVFCQQGLQFFPDKVEAVAEMRRTLAPGGRLALAVWRSDEESPFLLKLRRIAERRVGPIQDARHGFPDEAALGALLSDAGFEDVTVEPRSLTMRFGDGAVFVHLNTMALVGMSAAGKDMDEEARAKAVAAIAEESAELLADYSDRGALSYEITSNVATARRAAAP